MATARPYRPRIAAMPIAPAPIGPGAWPGAGRIRYERTPPTIAKGRNSRPSINTAASREPADASGITPACATPPSRFAFGGEYGLAPRSLTIGLLAWSATIATRLVDAGQST